MTALELRNVSKTFAGEQALDSVSLAVEDGEFFTLVGPSGCGKTTTLRLIAGLTEPSAGTVRIGGKPMAGVPPEDRNVGIVFQNYALFPHMTVAENVAYGLKFHDPPRGVSTVDRVQELLELVDLAAMGDREPETLSGGQQQRVALARALAPGPELLLLDEPMSALDARLRDRLRRTVREIQSELGITTIYVTHDQSEALAVSERIAVMNAGRVEQVGNPEAVYREPANRFVASFVGDNNLFEVQSVTRSVATVEGGAEIAVGEEVDPGDILAVRPEAMHLGSDDTVLEPRLESVEFQGTGYTLHCRLGTRDLLVKTAGPPTEPMQVGFSTGAVQVLREVEPER
ncbi:ABC transporter ATP-binding protein [Halodesulfurarchaeum sp.]|uniref:ABC transporter ATP-binding protein n=1 Tax=Halodesulfurarchaeum sp. TaxID=1980530 RepID=UPI001BBCB830|nr:ABC transporter ATP-binding protein [Halodesulfurarchaeum sp.]